MSYYYALNGQQMGPVSEEQLRGLVAAGTLAPDGLIWREGMDGWQPFATALGGAAQAVVECAVCHQKFPAEQTIRTGNMNICAGCKPRFVQGLREGAVAPGGLDYATGGKRAAAKIIDWVIVMTANVGFMFVIFSMRDNPALGIFMNILSTVLGFAYPILFLGFKGQTPGKMAMRIMVVRPDESRITWGQAIGRPFAEILSGCFLVGYFIAFWDDEKRTLHDRLAGTRVINVG